MVALLGTTLVSRLFSGEPRFSGFILVKYVQREIRETFIRFEVMFNAWYTAVQHYRDDAANGKLATKSIQLARLPR